MADFEISRDGGNFIASGQLDMASAPTFQAALMEAMPSPGGPVLVDVRGLEFMDSSGIQAIIAAARALPADCIVLHGVHDEVQKVVKLTKIDQLPNLHVLPCTTGLDPIPG